MRMLDTIKTLKAYLEPLSDKAKALASVAYILSSQSLTGTFSVAELRGIFRLSDDAEWAALYEELYENAVLYFLDSGEDEAEVMFAADLLSTAVGPSGRPSSKDWKRQRAWLEQKLDGQPPSCLYCRSYGVPLAIDHLRPVSRGGSNHLSNLAFACKPCNSAKGSKTFQEFMAWRKARGL